MQISKVTFTGTTEEFLSVAHLFSNEASSTTDNTSLKSEDLGKRQIKMGDEDKSLEGESIVNNILRVLTRIEIPLGQRLLYKVLYHEGDNVLSATELAARMNKVGKLPGILGALGLRVNHTPGVSGEPGIALLLNMEHRNGEWHYTMKQELHEALEQLNPPPDWLRHNGTVKGK